MCVKNLHENCIENDAKQINKNSGAHTESWAQDDDDDDDIISKRNKIMKERHKLI